MLASAVLSHALTWAFLVRVKGRGHLQLLPGDVFFWEQVLEELAGPEHSTSLLEYPEQLELPPTEYVCVL